MKKAFSIVMVLMLAVGILAACGPDREESAGGKEGSGSDGNKPEKLVVWEDTDKSVALEPAAKAFEEEHGIKVEFKEYGISEDMRNQIRLDGPADKGPDVLTLPHDQIGMLAEEGTIQEISVEQSVLDTFTESSIQAQTYDGKLYGLPKATETPVFIYNKELMPEAPATMDEVYDFAKDFTDGKKFGFIALWDNFYHAYAVIGGMGGYVFGEKDGALQREDLGLNNEGAVAGAEYIQKWYKEGLFPKGVIGESGGSAQDGLFNEGKLASVQNGPWAFQGYMDAGIDIGATPMPTLPNGEHMTTFMGVKGWHVSAYTKNKEWATKLVEFLTNYDNAKIRFEKTKEIPPVKKLIEDPIIADDEFSKAVAVQSQYAIPMPNIPEMAEVWGPMATALQTLATNKAKPQEAMDEAAKTIQTNIETNHSK
ncbi:cyclodextrin-binding protein [Bacillus sp. FJAT-27916]|uniref:extracellular solute-binding protein n=1 Tax=Bacillaceae TaxID=186817 RepID=UPI000670D63E|nr:extracellular solute-binding protein [Bacillus sp. FJAT-27916]KMY45393.1 cyclodextrin-binding protein [Bacillus sp. FJAT-27916]